MRKWLKPEIWLIVSGVVLAAAAGPLSRIIYEFVRYGGPTTFVPITSLEAKTQQLVEIFMFGTEIPAPVWNIGLAVLLAVFSVLLLRSLSGDFTFTKFRSFGGATLWILGVCFAFAAFEAPFHAVLFENSFEPHEIKYYLIIYTLNFIVPVLGFAVTWLIVGSGRSGDGRWDRRSSQAVRGAIVGMSVLLFHYLSHISETMLEGINYVYHGAPFEFQFNTSLLSAPLIIDFFKFLLLTAGVAGVAMALSFRNFSRKTRIKWAGLAAALCVGMFIFSGGVYLDNRSELNELKKPLALTAGLSLKEQPPWEIIRLKDKSGETVQWPVEFTYRNPFEIEYGEFEPQKDDEGYEIYPATEDNLSNLSKYIERSKVGFAMLEAYSDALIGGYYARLDDKKAEKAIVRFSDDLILPRMRASFMFRHMPVTEENRALLRDFAQGIDWYESGGSGINLCRMCVSMGMAKEGEKWCSLYREYFGKSPNYIVYEEPPLGSIRGIVTINRKPLRNGKVILIAADDFDSIADYRRTMWAVLYGTVAPGQGGDFKFEGIKGDVDTSSAYFSYELAVVFDHPLEYEVLGIDNPPGIINVTAAHKDIDLGVINIRTKKKD